MESRWFQTLGISVMNQPMYSIENVGGLIDMLTDISILLCIGLHHLGACINNTLYSFYLKNIITLVQAFDQISKFGDE